MKIKIFEKLLIISFFSLPLYLIKASFFGMPTNLLEIIIGLTFVFWIVEKRYSNVLSKIGKETMVSMALIILGFIVSTIINRGHIFVSLGIIKGWILFPALLILMGKSYENKEVIFKSYFFSALAVSLIALGYLYLGTLTFDGRLEAIYNSPNYLAMFLAPAIITGLYFSISRGKIYALFLAPMIFTLYFTYSYASWTTLFIAIYCLIFMWKDKFDLKRLIIAPTIFLIAFLFLQSGNQKMIDAVSFSERSSLSSREMIWRASFEMIKTHWAFGIGPGNFQSVYLEYQNKFPLYLEWAVPHPHNTFLTFWLYSGVMGVFGFIALVTLKIRNIFDQKEKTGLYALSFAIIIYFLLHGLVDTTFFKNDLAILFLMAFL